MEDKLLGSGSQTPVNMSMKDTSFSMFDPLSPTQSSLSTRRLQRKPDITRKQNPSRGKKQSMSSIFAGFYSPNQFDKVTESSKIFPNSTLKELNGHTKREGFEKNQTRQTGSQLIYSPSIAALKKANIKQYERILLKQNEQKDDNPQFQALTVKNKKLEQQISNLRVQNSRLQEKVKQLSSSLKDLQKKLQNKQQDIKQYMMRQKNVYSQLSKLRHQNISLEQQNKDQQSQLDLLDRKYLEVQSQVLQMRRNKDSKRRDSSQFLQKIAGLEQVIKQKEQEVYILSSQNSKISCQNRIKDQRLHELQNNSNYKKDVLLEQTNKKLRMVNKELMHRINKLIMSSSDSDVSFELSPQK